MKFFEPIYCFIQKIFFLLTWPLYRLAIWEMDKWHKTCCNCQFGGFAIYNECDGCDDKYSHWKKVEEED